MWTLCIITLTTVSVAFNADYLYNETSLELNSLFISTSRNFWAFSVSWVIFALDFGSCKWLGDFLSHKLWLPLGKLSFSIYLAHPVLQYALMSSQKQSISFDRLQMVSEISI
jgi:peptidoglycan/LPS O-acetylase OafA/YrhL